MGCSTSSPVLSENPIPTPIQNPSSSPNPLPNQPSKPKDESKDISFHSNNSQPPSLINSTSQPIIHPKDPSPSSSSKLSMKSIILTNSLIKPLSSRQHQHNQPLPFTKSKILSDLSHFITKYTASLTEYPFHIVLTKTITLSKSKYTDTTTTTDDDVYTKTIHYGIINNDLNLNWKRKPYKQIQQSINDYFNANKDISNQNNFQFNCKYIKAYEPFPQVDLIFTKLNTVNNAVTKSKFNISTIHNKTIIFLIFDISNLHSLYLLQKISTMKTSQCVFIPVYGKEILSKKEPLYIYEQIQAICVDCVLEQQCLYFINEQQQHSIKDIVEFITDDEQRKVVPKVVVVDNKGIVRLICKPEEFNTTVIQKGNDNISKEEFHNVVKGLQNVIAQMKVNCELYMKVTTMYEYNKDSAELVKCEKYYETVNGVVETKEVMERINKEVTAYNVVLIGDDNHDNNMDNDMNENEDNEDNEDSDDNEDSEDDNEEEITKCEIKVHTFGKQNSVINKEMANFSNVVGIEFNDYETVYTVSHHIYTVHPHKPYQLDNKTSTAVAVDVLLEYEQFEQQFQFALTSAMSVLYTNPLFPSIHHIGCLPKSHSTFPSSLTLFNNATSQEETIPFQTTIPSLLIIFAYSDDYFIREETLYKLKKLLPFMLNKSTQIQSLLIFRGEQNDYLKLVDELGNDNNLFLDNDITVYICNSNYSSTFPFYYQHNGVESFYSAFNVCLLSVNNEMIYKGSCGDVHMTKLIDAMINGDVDNAEGVHGYKVNVDEKELSKVINKLQLSLNEVFTDDDEEEVKELNYRPFIHFSYAVRYTSHNKRSVDSIRLAILFKEFHVNVLTVSSKIKSLLKELFTKYNAVVLVIPLLCYNELEFNSNCCECNEDVNKENGFYYDQEENEVYCEKCEERGTRGKTFKIFFKYNDDNIDNEIIEEFYYRNVYVNEPVDKFVDEICDLCEKEVGKEFYLSLTQLNADVGFVPFCICGRCFEMLKKGEKVKKGVVMENMKRFCVDKDKLIFRKIAYD